MEKPLKHQRRLGLYLNKLGGGLGDNTYLIKILCLVVSDKKILTYFVVCKNIFTDRSKAVHAPFVDHFCIYVLCLSCFVCSLPPCGHLLGKVWPWGSGLLYVMFYCVFVTFPSGVLLDCIDS